MPSLSDHTSSRFTKLLFIGDSGTGKTGALASLVKAGYDLRILDMDNGLDSLVAFVKKECPDRLSAVQYEQALDKYNMTTQGPQIVMPAKAFVEATKLMTKWTDGSVPAEWGDKTIFVLDSLSAMGRAAFAWAQGLNPGAKDPRQWYFAAQQALENIVQMISSGGFKTNVIIISHVAYKELGDGTTKGHPNALGSALGPIIPRYFNTLVLAESKGFGESVKRKIKTMPTGMIDLKNPAPFKVEKEYDLGTGLAELFKKLRE